MNATQPATILFVEPRRIADWHEGMAENFSTGLQDFTPRFHFIRLASSILSAPNPLGETDFKILRDITRNYPELAPEIQACYPNLSSQ